MLDHHRPERSATVCIEYWPTVIRSAKPGFEQSFALSVVSQSRRRNWRPSEKQLRLMRKMVDGLFSVPPDSDDDLSLIE